MSVVLDAQQNKQLLRTQFRHRRQHMSQHDVTAASALLALNWPSFAQNLLSTVCKIPTTIALYNPIQNELDVHMIWSWAYEMGFKTCFPKTTGSGQMHFIYNDFGHSRWVKGPYGIDEPVGERVDMDCIDLMFVPGLAFSLSGHRLGQGGGYYDRWLALRAMHPGPFLSIGTCYDWQVAQNIPVSDHDQTMDIILRPEALDWSQDVEYT